MLKPARRPKKLYAAIRSLGKDLIEEELFNYFGISKFGELLLEVKEYEEYVIIAVERKFFYEALGYLLSLPKHVEILAVSGTLRKLREKLKKDL